MLIEKLQNFASQSPDKQAIVYKGKVISYANLLECINERADLFYSNIFEKKVLLNHTDELENLFNFLALISIGKVGIFVSKHLNNKQIEDLSEQHSAFILNENSNTFYSSPYNNRPKRPTHKSLLNTLFLGVLTSGTTSTPNLIWKDYQSWFSAFPHQTDVFGISQSDRLFVIDALSYSANLNAVLHILWLGGTVVLTSLKSANSWAQQIEKEQVNSIFMVPSHYRLLLNNGLQNYQIKSLVSAGEKLDSKTAKCLMDLAPNALLTEYYGSAELGHITFHQNEEIINNAFSVGKVFPEVKISIENEQIFVQSPYISPDFRKIKTNFDLGYFIDNQLILMGRAGRMFNRRGLNVFAEEIENLVKELPFVIDATALGFLQETGSHEIYLAYTCQNGYQNNINNQQIIRYLSDNLQASKRPDQIKEFNILPRTQFGKIDFNALARSFEEEIFVA
jgi:long-chain acyl-CoA synthetase